jgi:adenosylcobyric acid synthase
VFPHAHDIHLDAEDSLALETRPRTPAPAGARIAIIRFPYLSNATDFRVLTWADWISTPPLDDYDFVILPGSKDTLADLAWLRSQGLADWVIGQHRRGTCIVGICGGFQMMGVEIRDPHGVESDAGSADGLGLLPARTTLAREKRTRAVQAVTRGGSSFGGYEIHLGETTVDAHRDFAPFATLEDGSPEGVRSPGLVATYLHGAFESADVCAEIFGVRTPAPAEKASEYNRLADWFVQYGRHLDELL